MINFNSSYCSCWVANEVAVHTTLVGMISLTLLLYHKMRPKFPCGVLCPESHHFYGFLPSLAKHMSRFPTEMAKICYRHNRTWGAPLPRIPGMTFLPPIYLFIFHEDNVKYVLQDNFKNYEKGDTFRMIFGELLGEGIFAVDGNAWKNHRKVMSTMFSRSLLNYSVTVTRQKLQQVLSDMEKKISSHSQQRTEPLQIDLKDLIMRLMFDLTSKVAFGVDLNTVTPDSSSSGQHKYFKAFDAVNFSLDDERCLLADETKTWNRF